MGIVMSVLLAGQRNRAQDGNENQNRRYFEGKQQVAEKNLAEVAGRNHVVSQASGGQMAAGGKKDECQQGDQHGYPRDADDVGGMATVGTFFRPGVEQHDDEGKQNHDSAGIDDHLGGSQELRTEQEVEHGQRAHHHNQREGAVDRVALEEEVQGSCYTKAGKEDEENQIHASAFLLDRARR